MRAALVALLISASPAFAQTAPNGSYFPNSPTWVNPYQGGGYSIYQAPRFDSDGRYIGGSLTRVTPDETGGYTVYHSPRFGPDGRYIPGSTIRVRPEY
jgi:hypothetical protein